MDAQPREDPRLESYLFGMCVGTPVGGKFTDEMIDYVAEARKKFKEVLAARDAAESEPNEFNDTASDADSQVTLDLGFWSCDSQWMEFQLEIQW